MALVEAKGLSRYFGQGLLGRRFLRAVDDVSFQVEEGKTFGLVGESGCGKSTLGRMLARILRPSAGRVLFKGIDLFGVNGRGLREIRPRIQMVFQEPDSALNPRLKIGDSVLEPLQLQKVGTRSQRRARVLELVKLVGLHPEHLGRYPAELSGGEIQRAVLARVLAVEPSFIVLDEPTSSLDVSVQAQILCLLKDLQHRFGLTYLFISHDLEVVTSMSQQLAVMYLGRFVEVGEADVVLGKPTHPYTRLLLSTTSLPRPVLEEQSDALTAEYADRSGPPCGCPFAPRCAVKIPQCDLLTPHLRAVRDGHSVACHRL